MPEAEFFRAHRFALRLKPGQEQVFSRWGGQLRWVWNHALGEQQRRRAAGQSFAHYEEMCRWLTAWRNSPATAWLSDCPAQAQQYTLKCLHRAFMRFFDNCKLGRPIGYPKFKPRGREPGLRCPSPKKFKLDWSGGRIFLPKIGWVRVRLSREIRGELRNVTVTREGTRWFVTIQERVRAVIPSADVQPTLGIDLGVATFAGLVNSSGLTARITALSAREKSAARLKRYQRAFRRKKKGSKNCAKAAKKVGNLVRKTGRQRRDWLHKLSTQLANAHAVIAIEDLKVAMMTRSARGSVEAPGRCVRVKACLTRGITDQGWGIFRTLLEYKLKERGGALVRVPPAHSSQTCRLCGHVDPESRKRQASFACTACGHSEHADVNAAGVILQRGVFIWNQSLAAERRSAGGHPVTACGGDVSRSAPRKRAPAQTPEKQENVEGQDLALAPG